MSLFGKNIRKIRSVKAMSQQAFAEIFDLKRGTLGAYEEGRSEPKTETIIKIANYFSIPIDDLLTKELTVNQLLKFKGDIEDHFFEETKHDFISVPCITPEQQNDYIKNASLSSFINSLPSISLPNDNAKKKRAYIVDDLEMSTENGGLYPKDIVFGEWIPKSAFDTISPSHMYLILTSNALVLKRIYPKGDTLTLTSDYKGIEEQHITTSEIKELWEIKSVLQHRLPDTKNNHVLDKIAFLENEFKKLKSSM